MSGEAEHARVLLSLVLVFVPAKLLAALCERFRLPGLVGEILAGILIGPHVLGWLAPNAALSLLAELGVLFLLFRVGLEVKGSELLRVGRTALAVATAGVILPFLCGWGLSRLWGRSTLEALFIGTALVATSVGVTAQVLAAQGLLAQRASQVILAAAVIDDVLGLLLLAGVSGFAHGGGPRLLDLGLTALLGLGGPLLVALVGPRLMSWLLPRVGGQVRWIEAEFTFSLILLFSLSLLAVYAGTAAIVGAFLAGMALSEAVDRRVRDLTAGVGELLVPFFLVGIGLRFDTAAFATGRTLALTGGLFVAAVVSKLVGCGLGALSLGRKDSLRVGVGMVPRGEVGMVVAQIGLGLGVMSGAAFGVIVAISLATTLVAPPALRWAFRDVTRRRRPEEPLRLG